MESSGIKKIGIWMDQGHALLLGYQDEEQLPLEDLPSPIESHTRTEGEGNDLTRFGAEPGDASNNEHKKHNVHQNQIRAYFLLLEKKLLDKEELLLMGPGIIKTQFFNHLQAKKLFSKLKIEVLDADKMSKKQLFAKVKQKFSSRC
jgi:hypothetical protein